MCFTFKGKQKNTILMNLDEEYRDKNFYAVCGVF